MRSLQYASNIEVPKDSQPSHDGQVNIRAYMNLQADKADKTGQMHVCAVPELSLSATAGDGQVSKQELACMR